MDNRLGDIETFLMVATEGSFANAAKALRLTPSAVSRSIARLEQRLGVTLVRRTTRALALTREGMAYRDRMMVLLTDMMELETGLGEELASRVAYVEIGKREDDSENVFALESLPGYVERHTEPAG